MTGISKNNYAVLKQYVPAAPVASGPPTKVNGVDIPLGILPISGNNYINFYTYLASIDYNLSSRDQIRGRFINNRYDSLDNLANLPVFWTNLPQRFYMASVAHYHTFTPSLTNELRLAFNRFSQFYTVTDAKFPGLDAFPNLQIDNDLGIQIGPDGSAPQYTVQNTYQLVENLNWTKGKHTLKIGFDGRNVISPQHFIQRERGDYNWSTLEGSEGSSYRRGRRSVASLKVGVGHDKLRQPLVGPCDPEMPMYRQDLLASLRAEVANGGVRMQILALAAKVQDPIFCCVRQDRRCLRSSHPSVCRAAQDSRGAL